jgi:hypothetical protein
MYSSVKILEWWANSEEATRLTQGAQKEAITLAAQITRPPIE